MLRRAGNLGSESAIVPAGRTDSGVGRVIARGAWLLAGALALPASGQSFNIDFGDKTSLPAPTYAAMGLAGVWNSADFEVLAPSMLTPISGPFTGVWIVSYHGTRTSAVIPDSGTTGNDEALLDDGVFGTGDVIVPLTIEHLAPGRYKVVAYALRGNAPNQKTLIQVSNTLQGRYAGATLGGAWTGTFIEDVTYAQFGINVPDGQIDLAVAGGFFGQGGYCNGVQIIKACSADFTTTAPLHFLQIWILPERAGLAPRYDQRTFARERKLNRLCLVGSHDGREESVRISQDVDLYASVLEPGATVGLKTQPGRGIWLQVVAGSAAVNGEAVTQGDGMAIDGVPGIEVIGGAKGGEILLFDLA